MNRPSTPSLKQADFVADVGFVLSQTAGQDYEPESIPGWDRATALQALEIDPIPFDHIDGNVWGYALGKLVAVSPLSPLPDRTLLHEIAHVVLGHTSEGIEQDGPHTPRSLREVEAEGVALLCAAALGFNNRTDDGGLEFRGSEATMKIDRQRLAVYRRDAPNVVGTHAPEPEIYVRSGADGTIAHLQNWVDCMRSRKTPASDIRIGHIAARTSHLANIALREQRRVTWDGTKAR